MTKFFFKAVHPCGAVYLRTSKNDAFKFAAVGPAQVTSTFSAHQHSAQRMATPNQVVVPAEPITEAEYKALKAK